MTMEELLVDFFPKVLPIRICGFYELKFPLSTPIFPSFLLVKSRVNISSLFKMHKRVDMVALSEAHEEVVSVFINPANEVVGDAYI